MAAASWAGVKDYLQWNLAKWELAAKPSPNLSPGEIRNGFDYEAWFNYPEKCSCIFPLRSAQGPLRDGYALVNFRA
ncbi:MAG: hypothetical protein A2218_11380 [Elusimicrobia bacterium RIFOXYA2_FULL_53_38]|nr:MAG: hypothetical protein A2218_11380 [Elusimicrobia bacterium RIFOXYA2_FULL_53_38]